MKVFKHISVKIIFLVSFSLFILTTATNSSSASQIREARRNIDKYAKEIELSCIEYRHDFHMYPELSGQELRTSDKIAMYLEEMGIEVERIGKNGLVGVIKGKNENTVVALRADMDALPVEEKLNVEYRSKSPGVMHACGHDAHMAILLGTAKVLSKLNKSQRLPGTVKLIFQPEEEIAQGASMMIAGGALENPAVDAIFGLHVGPGPSGAIIWKPEGLMSSADLLKVVVYGKQSHAAAKGSGIDAIEVSSAIYLELKSLESDLSKNATGPVVITMGTITGGVKENILADKVEMTGTIRVFDKELRLNIRDLIRDRVNAVASSHKTTADVTISEEVGVTYNHPFLSEKMAATLERVASGKYMVLKETVPMSEDFSFYQEEVPGLFFFLGITPPGTSLVFNHSPEFLVDDNALIVGVRALASLAVDYLYSK